MRTSEPVPYMAQFSGMEPVALNSENSSIRQIEAARASGANVLGTNDPDNMRKMRMRGMLAGHGVRVSGCARGTRGEMLVRAIAEVENSVWVRIVLRIIELFIVLAR